MAGSTWGEREEISDPGGGIGDVQRRERSLVRHKGADLVRPAQIRPPGEHDHGRSECERSDRQEAYDLEHVAEKGVACRLRQREDQKTEEPGDGGSHGVSRPADFVRFAHWVLVHDPLRAAGSLEHIPRELGA